MHPTLIPSLKRCCWGRGSHSVRGCGGHHSQPNRIPRNTIGCKLELNQEPQECLILTPSCGLVQLLRYRDGSISPCNVQNMICWGTCSRRASLAKFLTLSVVLATLIWYDILATLTRLASCVSFPATTATSPQLRNRSIALQSRR